MKNMDCLTEKSENNWLKTYIECEVYKGKIGIIQRFYYKHLNPSTNAVYLIRKMQYLYKNKGRIGFYLSQHLSRVLIKRYGLFVSPKCVIEMGLSLPHPNGIIIGEAVQIGRNCKIFQQVTIGSSKPGDYIKGMQPKIGNNVWLFAGSKVIGDIIVEDETCLGANAVLLSNTERGGVYVGVPACRTSTQVTWSDAY